MAVRKHSVSEYNIKLEYGQDVFSRAMDICEHGDVSDPEDLGEGMSRSVVVDARGDRRVVFLWRREHAGDLRACSCGGRGCVHEAAVEIHRTTPFGDLEEFDESADEEEIQEVMGMIEGLDDEISSDPDFDEESWCYEGEYWWERRYGTHGIEENHRIADDAVGGVIDEIMGRFDSPDTIVRLISYLHSKSGDYSFGSVEDALKDLKGDLDVMLEYVSPETVARCIDESDSHRPWILEVAGRLPAGVLDGAMDILYSEGCDSGAFRTLMKSRGDYSGYVERSTGNTEHAILDSIEDLISQGRVDEARAFASRLNLAEIRDRHRAARALGSAGMAGESSDLYAMMFVKEPHEEYLDEALKSGAHTAEELVREAIESGTEHTPNQLTVLVRHGAADYAMAKVEERGYLRNDVWRYGRPIAEDPGVAELGMALIREGRIETGAELVRRFVTRCIDRRLYDQYPRATGLLHRMGDVPELESLPVPHSSYLAGLRAAHPRSRKFWDEFAARYRADGSRLL